MKTLRSKISFFLITCLFLWIFLTSIKCIFYKCWKKTKKIFSRKKSFSVYEGAPFKPFKHTMTFSRNSFFLIFFLNIHKKCIWYLFKTKRKNFLTARSSNCSVSAKFFPMLVKTLYFGRIINKKTYLNHELGSKFVFLSSLPYKLVNLFVFEKWARTEFFLQLLVRDSTLPMNLQSV